MAGRKRKTAGELRQSICFSVSPDTKWYAAELRRMGVQVNEIIEKEIREAYKMKIEGSL